MTKKLLLIGSESVHIYNFYELIKSYFDEIVLITTSPSDFMDSKIVRKYVVNSSLHNPFNYFAACKKMTTIIQNEKPDIIHIQQIITASFFTIRANRHFNIPVVTTAWGSDVLLTPEKGFLYKKMAQYCLIHSDYLTADAQYIGDKMQKMVEKNLKITIANFGIEDVTDMTCRKENIIYSNRLLNKLYRIDSIIYAFDRFVKKEKYSDWKLVIAGVGTEEDKLKKLVNDLHLSASVVFVGWLSREDNLKWYSKAKIWMAFPESDATSISLLEAMSLQCIPVITDLPATREWINNNDNGLLVSDLSSFNIETALTLNMDHLIQKNTDIILKRATKSINSQKFLAIYQSIFNKKNEN